MHIIYAAFGRAGKEVLDKLLKRTDVDIPFCFTYDHPENQPLIDTLKEYLIPYTTDRLTTKGLKDIYTIDGIECGRPDFIISMHYRDLIPKGAIDFALKGGMNLHPALLPKYRGCFSAPWAIINGEHEAGITYHMMNEKFDDGKIILQKPVKITNTDTGFSLFNKLIDEGVSCFDTALDSVFNPNFKLLDQIGTPSYYNREVPYNGEVNEQWPMDKIDQFIRAMYFPGKPPACLIKNGEKYYFNTTEEYLKFRGNK